MRSDESATDPASDPLMTRVCHTKVGVSERLWDSVREPDEVVPTLELVGDILVG